MNNIYLSYDQPEGESLLQFGAGNGKLDDTINTFALPAGWTCPGASKCLAKADRKTGRITDGDGQKFRCFAAMGETYQVAKRAALWNNFDRLKAAAAGLSGPLAAEAMAQLILQSMPQRPRTVGLAVPHGDGHRVYKRIIRLHVGGDFFSQDYFDAWVRVAQECPDTLFYGYTKSLRYWVARLGTLPPNFVLTASYGGRHDRLISRHGLRFARVVFSVRQAEKHGLQLDHDDSHAMRADGLSFALLVHGSQKAGSPAAKALATLRAGGEFGYGKLANKRREAAAREARTTRFALPTLN